MEIRVVSSEKEIPLVGLGDILYNDQLNNYYLICCVDSWVYTLINIQTGAPCNKQFLLMRGDRINLVKGQLSLKKLLIELYGSADNINNWTVIKHAVLEVEMEDVYNGHQY